MVLIGLIEGRASFGASAAHLVQDPGGTFILVKTLHFMADAGALIQRCGAARFGCHGKRFGRLEKIILESKHNQNKDFS